MPSSEPTGRTAPAGRGGPVDLADLKAVRGIGPKVEALLKKAGISDLGALARTPVNELAAALAGLHGKFDTDRIIRERWLTQAAALAAVRAAGPHDMSAAVKPVRHSFTVEVRLLLADRDIVSSKIVHVQTGDQETWTGWDPQRMVAFIEDRSGNRRPQQQPDADHRPQPDADREAQPAPAPVPRRRPGRAVATTSRRCAAYAMVPASGLVTIGARASVATATLSFDSAALDLDETATVSTAVFARQLTAGSSVLVGDGKAAIGTGERFCLEVPCDLSAPSRPITLFAVVRVLARNGAPGQPAEGLPGASLVISKMA